MAESEQEQWSVWLHSLSSYLPFTDKQMKAQKTYVPPSQKNTQLSATSSLQTQSFWLQSLPDAASLDRNLIIFWQRNLRGVGKNKRRGKGGAEPQAKYSGDFGPHHSSTPESSQQTSGSLLHPGVYATCFRDSGPGLTELTVYIQDQLA